MRVSFRQRANGNSMVTEDFQNWDKNSFELQMILKNHIPGLLKTECEALNGENRLLYDITSRQALNRTWELGKMKRNELIGLVSSIRDCVNNLNSYLLDPAKLMLDSRFIFCNPDRCRFFFCYNPFQTEDFNSSMKKLFDQIISAIDYEDSALVKMAYELHMTVQNDNFSIEHMAEQASSCGDENETVIRPLFAEEMNDAVEQAGEPAHEFIRNKEDESKAGNSLKERNSSCEDTSFMAKLKRYLEGKKLRDIIEDIDDGVIIKKINGAGNRKNTGNRVKVRRMEEINTPARSERPLEKMQDPDDEKSFWDSVSFTEMPLTGTARLAAGFHAKLRMVGMDPSDNEIITAEKFPLTLGKLAGGADYVINSAGVSRIHARIYESPEGGYLLEDLNSTNGTYLNGVKMEAYVKKEIKSGDVVSFADREYCIK